MHNADHVRRGANSVGRDVFWIGTSAIFLEVAMVVMACQRHRLADLVAAAAGFSLAAGYVFVHFLPARSWLSDSFTSGGNVSPLSVFAAGLEVVAAVTLGIVGLRGVLAPESVEQRPLREGLAHPLALTFIVSQVLVLAISLAQLRGA